MTLAIASALLGQSSFGDDCRLPALGACGPLLLSGEKRFRFSYPPRGFTGGDADTLAAIADSVAEAFYGGVLANMRDTAFGYIDPFLLQIGRDFSTNFYAQQNKIAQP